MKKALFYVLSASTLMFVGVMAMPQRRQCVEGDGEGHLRQDAPVQAVHALQDLEATVRRQSAAGRGTGDIGDLT